MQIFVDVLYFNKIDSSSYQSVFFSSLLFYTVRCDNLRFSERDFCSLFTVK